MYSALLGVIAVLFTSCFAATASVHAQCDDAINEIEARKSPVFAPVETTLASPERRSIRRRLGVARLGTAVGALILPGAGMTMALAGFIATPWCATYGDEPDYACEDEGSSEGAVIGLSTLAGVATLASVTLLITQPIRIHRARRDRRALESICVGLLLPDQREPAMRLVIGGSF